MKSVLRSKRHILVFEVTVFQNSFSVFCHRYLGKIAGELGVCVAVVGKQVKTIDRIVNQGKFPSPAPAPAGIGCVTAQSALHEAGDLLVLDLHEECAKVQGQSGVFSGEVPTYFVVPGVFRLVPESLVDSLVIFKGTHILLKISLHIIAEHLDVETSSAIAFCGHHIDVVALVEVILEGKTRQDWHGLLVLLADIFNLVGTFACPATWHSHQVVHR